MRHPGAVAVVPVLDAGAGGEAGGGELVMIRNLRDHGLEEGVSTRLLVYAARLISQGVPARRAADVTMARPLTDDADMLETLRELVFAVFEE